MFPRFLASWIGSWDLELLTYSLMELKNGPSFNMRIHHKMDPVTKLEVKRLMVTEIKKYHEKYLVFYLVVIHLSCCYTN